jgi:hypothetical protein
VGLTPPPMANAMPPALEAPLPPEADEPPAAGAPVPSAGCGSAAAVASGRSTIDVAGATREYILALPEDYDASRPYRLIFAWHWRGGTAQDVANGFYGLEQRAEGSRSSSPRITALAPGQPAGRGRPRSILDDAKS